MARLIHRTSGVQKIASAAGYLLAGIIPLLLLTHMSATYAINASPHPIDATQPDGTKIVLKVKGDERFHWQEDANGYTVLRDKGRYVYAIQGPDGRLAPSDIEVGKASPKAHGLQKRTLPSRAVINQLRASGPGATSETSGAPEQVAPAGAIKNLVVMIRFSDHAGRALPSAADMDVLFNADAPDATLAPTGSLKAVYLENSYGQMTLNSTISGWIDVSNTEAYYADGVSGSSRLWEALREALTTLDASIDFGQYDSDNDGYIDAITFIHSGYGAEWDGNPDHIWSHKWAIQPAWTSVEGVRVYDYHISPGIWGTSGSNIGRIGVISHETGHFFGLPDLYDTNGGGEGIGSYGMMANSWGFDGSQYYPPHFSPWSKINLGWVTPTLLDAAGAYNLQQVEDIGAVYRVDNGYPSGEYLLIENRQPVGFDAAMPQGGLTIWHIDDAAGYNSEGYPGQLAVGPGGLQPWPDNGLHYRVALLQADGEYDLEQGNGPPYRGDRYDVWHAGGVYEINGTTLPSTDTYQGGTVTPTGNRISNISTSGSSMAFDFDNGLVPPPPVDPPLAPTLTAAVYDGGSNVDLLWLDLSDNEDGFKVFRSGNEVGSLSANNTGYQDTGVPAGSHDYYVQAFNSGGAADSNSLSVDVVLPSIAYASGESTTFGTVSGSYLNTHDSGDVETLTEAESGGKPSKRTSRLGHVWQFDNVGQGLVTTLTVDATAAPNGEGDDFSFSYSVDGGQTYNQLFVLTADGAEQQMLAELSAVGSTVLVKVEDTDRTQGGRTLDSISIRQMSIGWTDDVVFTPPSNLTATAVSDTRINLDWTDGTGEGSYTVRDDLGAVVQTGIAANTTMTSITGLTPETAYSYEVCGIGSDLSVLGCSNLAQATTLADPGDAPVLTSAVGSKVKGVQRVDLSWTYTGAVDIYRTGTSDATIVGVTDGSYLDVIGAKGGATYSYQVCPAENTFNCSNMLGVTF